MSDVPRLFLPDFATVAVIGCSPPGWACQLALEEKSVPREDVWLDFARGEHKAPEMRARNPRGTVPMLEHDGHVVHETLAVLDYIDRTWPVPVLVPPRTRAVALTRLHEAAYLKGAGMDLFGWLMRTPRDRRTPEDLAPRATVLWRELQVWERILGQDAHVAGPHLTLADLVVYPYLATAQWLGLDLSGLPNLDDYCRRMRRRSSVVRTWPEPWAGDAPDRPLAGLGGA